MSTPDQMPDINCRLDEVAEAFREKRTPEASPLGVVACVACNGIFDVHLDAGEKPRVENLVFVPCIKGYSNNPEAQLDE